MSPSRRRGGRKHVRFYSGRLATPTRDSKAATAMSHNTRPRRKGFAGLVSDIKAQVVSTVPTPSI